VATPRGAAVAIPQYSFSARQRAIGQLQMRLFSHPEPGRKEQTVVTTAVDKVAVRFGEAPSAFFLHES
jgi:hypothetical protein